jgi:protein TonB
VEAAAKERRIEGHAALHVAKNGSVSGVRVEKSSGNQTFDDSAVQAVRLASPFPQPPKSFPIGDLRMVLKPNLTVPDKQSPMPKARQQQI